VEEVKAASEKIDHLTIFIRIGFVSGKSANAVRFRHAVGWDQ
jgi:hypothetical protein